MSRLALEYNVDATGTGSQISKCRYDAYNLLSFEENLVLEALRFLVFLSTKAKEYLDDCQVGRSCSMSLKSQRTTIKVVVLRRSLFEQPGFNSCCTWVVNGHTFLILRPPENTNFVFVGRKKRPPIRNP